jgi:hypothetical protein
VSGPAVEQVQPHYHPDGSVIEIQWHAPDMAFAAGFLRDGQPWILDGALVGMGATRGAAVDDLTSLARELVRTGENCLSDGQVLPLTDRRWLFDQIDPGPDLNDDLYAAMRHAEETEKGTG